MNWQNRMSIVELRGQFKEYITINFQYLHTHISIYRLKMIVNLEKLLDNIKPFIYYQNSI